MLRWELLTSSSTHLKKHRNRVESFYRQMITGRVYARETTVRFRKRFERYRESLFCFLETLQGDAREAAAIPPIGADVRGANQLPEAGYGQHSFDDHDAIGAPGL